MGVPARIERDLGRNRRSSARRKLRLGSTSPRSGHSVVIHDISTTGMLIETAAKLEIPEEIEVELPESGTTKARITWNNDKYYGCEFLRRVPQAAVSAALLRSPALDSGSEAEASPDATRETAQISETATELSFGTKLRFILGLSIASWALILLAFRLI